MQRAAERAYIGVERCSSTKRERERGEGCRLAGNKPTIQPISDKNKTNFLKIDFSRK
jgi:hypothetical protein